MSLFGVKFSQMILHTETSKLMYNWSFLFVVLHKPTLLPSTFKGKSPNTEYFIWIKWSVIKQNSERLIKMEERFCFFKF